jgi:hypothetical protein
VAKWSELEAAGIRRCCAVFTSGRQCARRVSADAGGTDTAFCVKHESVRHFIDRVNRAAIDELKPRKRVALAGEK